MSCDVQDLVSFSVPRLPWKAEIFGANVRNPEVFWSKTNYTFASKQIVVFRCSPRIATVWVKFDVLLNDEPARSGNSPFGWTGPQIPRVALESLEISRGAGTTRLRQ